MIGIRVATATNDYAYRAKQCASKISPFTTTTLFVHSFKDDDASSIQYTDVDYRIAWIRTSNLRVRKNSAR